MFSASKYGHFFFISMLIFFRMKLWNSFFTFWKPHKCQHSPNVNWTYFIIYNSDDSTFKSRPVKFLSPRRFNIRLFDEVLIIYTYFIQTQDKWPAESSMLWWSLVEFRRTFVRRYNGRNLDGLGLSLRNRKLWKKTRRGHVAHIPVIRLTSCKTESFTIPWDLV